VNYWKGLAIAATLDLAWLMGSPALTGVDQLPPVEVAMTWTEPTPAPVADTMDYVAISQLEDSLMTVLNENPEHVATMERLAALYMEHGWHDQAIGPLARALQIDAEQRSLWVALDRAVEGAGMAKITDAELTRRALEFKERVEMWGGGC